jgi:predicted GTPase
VNPLKQWRYWLLSLLLVGPILAYMGLGMLWLWERGWLILGIATTVWVTAGILFSILAARWTQSSHPILPPLDWEAPQTFSPRDREAWALVQQAADEGDQLPYEALLEADLYINSGRQLFQRLASHYHPLVTNPIDDVPLVELLTALELATEDLERLCRQVPGGDLVTLSHWRTAVQVAGYISKANDLYSYLLPFLSPVGGLARWGTREWIVKPAWKNMQQNLLRWFYQAYVNRLGTHLVEMLSGRLAIGADQYRRLTRRSHSSGPLPVEEVPPLTICVAGTAGSGKSRLIAALREASHADLTLLKARLSTLVVEPSLIDRLRDATLLELPDYSSWTEDEGRRDRARIQAAVDAAVGADMLILAMSARQTTDKADLAFAQRWDRWFIEHPHSEAPPALVVLTGVEGAEFGNGWQPPYDWTAGRGAREVAVRARIESLRTALPPKFSDVIAVGLTDQHPFGVIEQVLPAIATHLHKAERTALIRRLHEFGGRSKVGRLAQQLGKQGKALWTNLRARRKGPKVESTP